MGNNDNMILYKGMEFHEVSKEELWDDLCECIKNKKDIDIDEEVDRFINSCRVEPIQPKDRIKPLVYFIYGLLAGLSLFDLVN